MKYEIAYLLPDGMKCSDATNDIAAAVVHWRNMTIKYPDADVRLSYLGLKDRKE